MVTDTFAPKVEWDYTAHAFHYDKRADYSHDAIEELLRTIGCTAAQPVAEIGAGTGKLTKELLKHGLKVHAVEPNESMGTGEATGLASASAYAILFGSSFNVVDQSRAMAEAARVLVPGGWFACLWNHRNLGDPVQQRIEGIIKSHIPDYSYGSRREDPTAVIAASRRFSAVRSIEGHFVWEMPRPDIVEAWKSHATLKRQAGTDALFERIIGEIAAYLATLPSMIAVPYTTRIYFAQSTS